MPGLLKAIAVISVATVAGFQAVRAEELGPTLQKIKASGAMTLGYRDASIPMSYSDAQAQPAGFALDLCALVASKVKQTLGLADLKIDYRPVAAADAPALLKNGAIAIDCAATPVSAELSQQAAFSNPIFVSELRWIVPQRLRVEREGRRRNWFESISPSSTEDLKGMPVALTRGSAAASLVLTISSDRSLGLSIIEAKDNAESFKLVETGKASAFLADSLLLMNLKANAKNPGAFAFLGEAYPGASYAFMLSKDDRAFKNLADGALAGAMRSGEYAELYAKWFESPIPPRNVNLAYPMPENLKALVKAAADRPAAQ
ncbi:MAG: amino acid ABC transporter substrate-binding protein [Rhodomicrobium sp.]